MATGVIVGINAPQSEEDLIRAATILTETFPGVRFATIADATSVAFEYDPDDGVAAMDSGRVAGDDSGGDPGSERRPEARCCGDGCVCR